MPTAVAVKPEVAALQPNAAAVGRHRRWFDQTIADGKAARVR